MFFFKKTQTKQPVQGQEAWVMDFGTHTIKILLCRYLSDHMDVIAGSKIKLQQTEFQDWRAAGEGLIKSLRQEIRLLRSPENQQSLPVIVGLSGYNIEGYSSQINYRRATPEKIITDGEFSNILRRVEERADQIMAKIIVWETESDNDTALINSEILDLSLDGYTVVSPIGLKGERLSFILYHAYTTKPDLNAVLNIMRQLNLEVLSISPTIYSMLRIAAQHFGPNLSAAVLDMGGKTTEVGIVESGRILGHKSFEVAGDSFTDSIANDFGCDQREAEILKLAFSSGKLPDEKMKVIREVISSDCKVFTSGVELVLKEFPGNERKSERFLVAGGGTLLPGVVSSLQSIEGSESIASAAKVDLLLPKDLPGFRDLTKKLNSIADLPILTVAIDAQDLVQQPTRGRGLFSKIISKALLSHRN